MQTKAIKLNIPFVPQINDYFCGPATLQMVLGYLGLDKCQNQLARIMSTKEKVGTKKNKMVRAIKEHNLHYCVKENSSFEDIEKMLKAGVPVVVYFIEPSENEHHYSVVAGLTKTDIILADPWNGRDFRLPREDFMNRWYGYEDNKKRWMMAVYKDEFGGCNCLK